MGVLILTYWQNGSEFWGYIPVHKLSNIKIKNNVTIHYSLTPPLGCLEIDISNL